MNCLLKLSLYNKHGSSEVFFLSIPLKTPCVVFILLSRREITTLFYSLVTSKNLSLRIDQVLGRVS